MDFMRKHKKIISYIWHLAWFGVAAYFYFERSNPDAWFILILIAAVLNHAASVINNNLYHQMKEHVDLRNGLLDKYEKRVPDMIKAMNAANRKLKAEILRNNDLKEMNDRLHSVNVQLRGGN